MNKKITKDEGVYWSAQMPFSGIPLLLFYPNMFEGVPGRNLNREKFTRLIAPPSITPNTRPLESSNYRHTCICYDIQSAIKFFTALWFLKPKSINNFDNSLIHCKPVLTRSWMDIPYKLAFMNKQNITFYRYIVLGLDWSTFFLVSLTRLHLTDSAGLQGFRNINFF